MARAAALTLLILSFMVGEAQATPTLPIYVVENPLAGHPDAAVGLLVPGSGPETGRAQALAALERGKMVNSLRGEVPSGPALVHVSSGPPPPASANPYIVLSLPPDGVHPNDRRYTVVVVGPGYHGLLVSDSTRIPGLVSIVDIAPTALGGKGALRSKPDSNPVSAIHRLDKRIETHNAAKLAASILATVIVLGLAIVSPVSALLSFASVLMANLLLGALVAPPLWVVLLVLGIAAAAGGPLLARVFRSDLAIGVLLAGVLAAYLAALGLRGQWVAFSPFNPTGNERFYGIGNVVETMLLVPALVAAALLRRRLGWPAFAAVALLAFVTVAGNRFGADGGGAIVFGVGFAVLAGLLNGMRGARLLATIAGVLVLVVAILALDAATGASTHVSRALGGGPTGVAADLRDRVVLSWRWIERSHAVTALVALSLPIFVVLVARRLRAGIAFSIDAPALALAAAVGSSLIVNDSPSDVLIAGLVGYVVIEAVMLRDRCAAVPHSPASSQPSPSSPPAVAPRRP